MTGPKPKLGDHVVIGVGKQVWTVRETRTGYLAVHRAAASGPSIRREIRTSHATVVGKHTAREHTTEPAFCPDCGLYRSAGVDVP